MNVYSVVNGNFYHHPSSRSGLVLITADRDVALDEARNQNPDGIFTIVIPEKDSKRRTLAVIKNDDTGDWSRVEEWII